MKKSILLLFALNLCLFNCEDSVSDEFEEVNGNTSVRLISSISVLSQDNPIDSENITINYNNNNTISTVSDGEGTSAFIYDSGDLVTITGNSENLGVEELYQSPYNAFETGEVLEYDNNGNPKRILFYEEEFVENQGYVIREYTAELSYDDRPNPYFYTLQAGGLIDVLDNIQVNFGSMSPQLVQARQLFPLNNPSQVLYRNDANELVFSVTVNYNYDEFGYPSTASALAVDIENSEQSTFSTIYTYMN